MPIPMTFSVVRWFIPNATTTGIIPAENYLCKFYAAGTSTPKAIYDVDGNIFPSPSSVAILNSEGYAALKLGTGTYKLRICTPETVPSADGGDAVYTEDNISGIGTFGTGFIDAVKTASPNGLADVDTNANKWIFAGGYWDKADGGHGMFYNATSSAADDGGYVIASTFDPTKRWFRVPDESGDIRAASFGYVGTKAGNLGSNLVAAAAYANGRGRLVIGSGLTATVGSGSATFTLTCAEIHFEAGSTLTGFTGVTSIVIAGKVTGPDSQIFGLVGSYVPITFTSNVIFTSPAWFGVSRGTGGTIGANNVIAFGRWFNSATVQSLFMIPPGDYPYTDTSSFPFPTTSPVLLGGRIIHVSAGSDIPTGAYYPADSRFRIHKLLFNEGFVVESSGANYALITGSASWVGDLNLSGTLTVSTISATTISAASVTGTTQVIGGTVYGGGRVGYPEYIGYLGQSAKQFGGGGVFSYTNASTDIKAGTFSKQVDASSLVSDGAAIRVIASGTCGDYGNFSVTVAFAGVTIATIAGLTTTSGSGAWNMNGFLIRNSSTTNKFISNVVINGNGVGSSIALGDPSATHASTWTSNNNLTFHATGSAAVTINILILEYIPVSPQA